MRFYKVILVEQGADDARNGRAIIDVYAALPIDKDAEQSGRTVLSELDLDQLVTCIGNGRFQLRPDAPNNLLPFH